MATRLFGVVIDSPDPADLADWWADALDWPVVHADGESTVAPPADAAGIELTFGPGTDERVEKNRIHLDLASTDAGAQQALVSRLLGAGASRVDVGQGDVPWVVLADPDGNEFCVLEPRAEYEAAGAVAAVVVEAADPIALARFWVSAAGWRLCAQDSLTASLCRPDGLGPRLEFIGADRPRLGKNRVHLDVAPGAGDDQAVEVARLHALDARPVDIGQAPTGEDGVTWVVLADPEGNEFCVLSPR